MDGSHACNSRGDRRAGPAGMSRAPALDGDDKWAKSATVNEMVFTRIAANLRWDTRESLQNMCIVDLRGSCRVWPENPGHVSRYGEASRIAHDDFATN